MFLFALATTVPTLLIILATQMGGGFAWMAFGYMTVLIAFLDKLVARQVVNEDADAEFPSAVWLLKTLGILHFILLPTCLWAVAGPSGLSVVERLLVGLSGGMVFGQIGHPVAHELIHQSSRPLRLMGRLLYTSLLVGHHASAHLRVHHIHVASDADPNTARLGEGFYRFALRAGFGSFRAGFAAERKMLARGSKPMWTHPYLIYVFGGIACVVLSRIWFGPFGMAIYVCLCLYAQMQILLSDYVQHYGLKRKTLPNGALEPVNHAHSWNAPNWFSSAVTLNAPRHSDHHVTPTRAFPALQLDPEGMPFLPRPLPIMAVVALVPPLWRRMMDTKCARWANDTE